MHKGGKNEVKWQELDNFEVKYIYFFDFLMELIYLIYIWPTETEKNVIRLYIWG